MKHLPECPNHCINVPADYMERDVYMRRCICEKLRACERRVLNAAREAVAAIEIAVVGNSAAAIDQAIAAIDALRGESHE